MLGYESGVHYECDLSQHILSTLNQDVMSKLSMKTYGCLPGRSFVKTVKQYWLHKQPTPLLQMSMLSQEIPIIAQCIITVST